MFGIKRVTKTNPVRRVRKRTVRRSLEWHGDQDLQEKLQEVILNIGFDHVKPERVFCYKTFNSKARAYARIWAFPKIFQEVLKVEPAYVIEVLSEKFDKLSDENKTKVIIHELLHIPKNFSGSLLPHKYGGKRIDHEVEKLFKLMKSK